MEEEFKYEKELQTIKNYVAINPNSPKYKVSAATGIDLDIISELIEEGYLEERNGELKSINRRKRMRLEERKMLVNRLGSYQSEESKLKEESQLVQDLRTLRNNKYDEIDSER